MKTPKINEQIEELIALLAPDGLDERMTRLIGAVNASVMAMAFIPDLESGIKNRGGDIIEIGVELAKAILSVSKKIVASATDEDWETIRKKSNLSKKRPKKGKRFLNRKVSTFPTRHVSYGGFFYL